MCYKSVIIHKNRIFRYFQNKLKNLNNNNNKIIIEKMNKKKRYILL